MNVGLTDPELRRTPHLPHDEEGPVFAEPWQAKAFAMTLSLHQAGLFTWSEWCEALSDEIRVAQARGDPDLGDTYYHHWLAALEELVAAKRAAEPGALRAALEDWRAADATRAFGAAPTFVKGAGRAVRDHD